MQNTSTVLVVVLAVILVLFLLGGFGMMGLGGFGMMSGGMMRGYGGYGGYGYGAIGAIISLVAWALIIAGVVLIVVWLVRNAGGAASAPSHSSIELLKARYAKGEITKEQFDVIKRDLEA